MLSYSKARHRVLCFWRTPPGGSWSPVIPPSLPLLLPGGSRSSEIYRRKGQIKKRLASLALTLVLCLSWSAAVFAEGNTIYLRYKPGTNGTYSVEKTEDAGDSGMSISGDVNITGVAANNPDEQNASQPKFLPYCVSSGPVTLTLMRDSEAIAESRIDAVLAASGGYTVTEEEPLRFEGATATISAPGVYHVEVRTADYSLGAQAIIEIIEGAVSSEPTSSPSTGFTDVAADSPFAEAIKWAVEKKLPTARRLRRLVLGTPAQSLIS